MDGLYNLDFGQLQSDPRLYENTNSIPQQQSQQPELLPNGGYNDKRNSSWGIMQILHMLSGGDASAQPTTQQPKTNIPQGTYGQYPF